MSMAVSERTADYGSGRLAGRVRIRSVTAVSLGDLAVGVALGLLVACLSLVIYLQLDPRLLVAPDGNDVWFEGDLPIVFHRLTDRWNDQSGSANHPLVPLLATVPVSLLRAVGLQPIVAVGVFIAAVAGVWAMLLYATLRVSSLRKADAAIFTIAGASTSAAIFWLPVPEYAALASTSMLFGLLCAALADQGRLRPIGEMCALAATLSITVTHWMAGLFLTFLRHPVRQATQLAVNAFTIVVVLWAVQRAVFPTADFFVGYAGYRKFILREESGGAPRVLMTLVAHSAVMPRIDVKTEPKWGHIMTIQRAPVGSGGAVAIVATSTWLCLLVVGATGLRSVPRTLRWVTLGTLAGQLFLHVLYGEETFLYTLSVVPLLLVIAASGVRTSKRPLALMLAGVFIISATWTNVERLNEALGFLEAHRPRVGRVHQPVP